MTSQSSSSKLLIPVALLATLAAGVAVTSPRKTSASLSPSASVPPESINDGIRARQLIFDSEDLKRDPGIWERAWKIEMPDIDTPYRVHGGVI